MDRSDANNNSAEVSDPNNNALDEEELLGAVGPAPNAEPLVNSHPFPDDEKENGTGYLIYADDVVVSSNPRKQQRQLQEIERLFSNIQLNKKFTNIKRKSTTITSDAKHFFDQTRQEQVPSASWSHDMRYYIDQAPLGEHSSRQMTVANYTIPPSFSDWPSPHLCSRGFEPYGTQASDDDDEANDDDDDTMDLD